jgi:O-antigen ligase
LNQQSRYAEWLLLAAIVALPFERLMELPMVILSLWGLGLVISQQVDWRSPAVRFLLAAYVCFALPMLLSLPDAVEQKRSVASTIGTLRYLLSSLAVVTLLAEPPRRVLIGVAVVVLFWSFDGILQAVLGYNIFGYGMSRGYVNSVFGEDDNLKLGFALACLFPLLTMALRERLAGLRLFASLLPPVATILLTGKRQAWLMLAAGAATLAAGLIRMGEVRRRVVLLVAASVLLLGVGAYNASEWVQERTDAVAMMLLDPDYESVNQALSLRLPIWQAAVAIGEDHWVNGIGPRGFRYLYADYAPSSDERWRQPSGDSPGAAIVGHPHQLLLELWAETGIFGLAGFVVLCALLIGYWRAADGFRRRQMLPFAAALMALFFPINTHTAWYSSWSALLMWWFLSIYFACGKLQAKAQDESSA